jgi:hypothetical protein
VLQPYLKVQYQIIDHLHHYSFPEDTLFAKKTTLALPFLLGRMTDETDYRCFGLSQVDFERIVREKCPDIDKDKFEMNRRWNIYCRKTALAALGLDDSLKGDAANEGQTEARGVTNYLTRI